MSGSSSDPARAWQRRSVTPDPRSAPTQPASCRSASCGPTIHDALFRIVARVDQLLLANLLLLGFVAFLPLPTRLVAQHTTGADARTAMLLYGATLAGCALAFNLIWRHSVRRGLLAAGVDP